MSSGKIHGSDCPKLLEDISFSLRLTALPRNISDWICKLLKTWPQKTCWEYEVYDLLMYQELLLSYFRSNSKPHKPTEIVRRFQNWLGFSI